MVAAREQHEVVAAPRQAQRPPEIDGVLHDVAHPEGPLHGAELVRREAPRDIPWDPREKPGDEVVGRRHGNILPVQSKRIVNKTGPC